MTGNENLEQPKFRRQSIRLQGYDYTREGAYFITICTWNRQSLFGQASQTGIGLNELGKIVRDLWKSTGEMRGGVVLDEFVVMPNHLHGILAVTAAQDAGSEVGGGEQRAYSSTPLQRFRSTSRTIGSIIRGFKSSSTVRINISRRTPGLAVWQRNYYEHIIRNDRELNATREYIRSNPANWEKDEEYVR